MDEWTNKWRNEQKDDKPRKETAWDLELPWVKWYYQWILKNWPIFRVDVTLTLLAAKGNHCAVNPFLAKPVGKGAAQGSTAITLTLGGPKSHQPGFHFGMHYMSFAFFFFFLLLLQQQQQQQQIYSPNYVWLWLNEFAFPVHTLVGGGGSGKGRKWPEKLWRESSQRMTCTAEQSIRHQADRTTAQWSRDPTEMERVVFCLKPPFIHSFMPQILTECPLSVRYELEGGGNCSELDK